MKRLCVRVLSAFTAVATMTAAAFAQGITISGLVTSEVGAPIPGANVYLQGLNIGTQTGTDGRYTFTVGSAYTSGQAATLTARVIGYTAKSVPVTLTAGKDITQDFTLVVNPLRLGDVVITGAGTSTTRERLATTVNEVDSSLIERHATPQNLVSSLSASAPNVEVRTQSGDPGSSASIKIRGASSVTGTNQPLFVIDGQPIDNSTLATTGAATETDQATQGSLQGTVTQNRAADINPNDIESIEILKGSAAAAIYGARAANGVVLITTKRGHSGATRYSLSSTETFDNVQSVVQPQMLYGLGSSGVAAQCMDPTTHTVTTVDCVPMAPSATTGSLVAATGGWGALIPAGTPIYNHATDIFRTGLTADNNLEVSGGNDRTTFFASGGLTAQRGVVVGPNNKYNRLSMRLKGTQEVGSKLNLGANLTYIDTRGIYLQNGSNPSGLLLGSLRTPADFNNEDYITSNGTMRPYRFPNPSGDAALINDRSGYYDNPFWEAFVNNGNRSELGRSISNINADWDPLSWLNVKYTLGGDYYNDWRLQVVPYAAANDVSGNIIRDDINNLEIDHNLTATATESFNDNIQGTLTVGQNLNSRRQRGTFLVGEGLITPLPYTLQNTTTFTDAENQSLRHIDAYFTQGELDLYNQLYLTLGVRDDGFSTFGASNQYAYYPKASVAWNFTNFLGKTDPKSWLNYGKLRLAYGETGKEPPTYAAVGGYTYTLGIGSGFGDVNGTTQNGNGGVVSPLVAPNPNLKPERQREFEGGTDLGLFAQRLDLGLTIYRKHSTDVIVAVPVSGAATGYQTAYKNGAQITNRGVELSLDGHPYTSKNVKWDVGVQFGKNKGNVDNLLGAQFIEYINEGFGDAFGSSTVGYAPGVLRGQDFARCGRGLMLPVAGLGANPGVTLLPIDSLCGVAGAYKKGALFLAPNGQPITDPTNRVISDPNPRYTISYNTSLKLYNKLTLSALVDARSGGQVWDGTRAGLDRQGTGEDTKLRSLTNGQFGKNFLTSVYPYVAGPGAGVIAFATEQQWQNWFQGAGGLNGVTQYQFVEDGSFVKFRELSLTYTMDQSFVHRYTGFSSADIRVAGRNLYTWTKYKGMDPEANLQGAETLTQGIDFFNDPQTRSLVVSVNLNR